MFPYSSAGRTSSRSFGIGFGNRVRLPEAADPPTVADLPARCGAIASSPFRLTRVGFSHWLRRPVKLPLPLIFVQLPHACILSYAIPADFFWWHRHSCRCVLGA